MRPSIVNTAGYSRERRPVVDIGCAQTGDVFRAVDQAVNGLIGSRCS